MVMSLCICYTGDRLESIDYNFKAWIFPLILWGAVIIFNNNYAVTVPLILLYPLIWYKLIITDDEQSRILQILK